MGLFRKKKLTPKKRALLVGINYKNTSSELFGCINDTKNVKEMLLRRGYEEKDIVMLNDNTEHLPTKHNIYINLVRLLKNDKNEKIDVFFQYSGHGAWVMDKNSDEDDFKDECLVPIDYKRAGMFYDDDIRDVLEKYMKPNTRLFVIVDACHSGTMLDLKHCLTGYDSKVSATGKVSAKYQMSIENYEKDIKGDVFVISGCQDTQTSADAFINRQSQGAMTFALLETLKNNQGSDLTCEKLIQGIYQSVKSNKFTQNPCISSNKTIQMENIVKF